jgi:YbbR domain-containing protein
MAFLHPFRNLALKGFSLGLAVLLWLAVSGQETSERNLRVPLEFQNVPAGMEIVGEPPNTVDVRIRGSSGNLSRVQVGDVVAVLDLASARPGSRLFHMQAEDVRAPFGVSVVQVAPSTISLEFELSGTKVVSIVPAVEGQPAPGYVIGRVMSSPSTVEVVGPIGRLRSVDEATTEPIDVTGATRTLQDEVTVGMADSALRLREPRAVTVTVEVLPAPVERTITNVPLVFVEQQPMTRASSTPDRVTVMVRGTREAVAALAAGDLVAEVDLSTLGPGRYSLPVRVRPREDVGVERVDPRAVTVVIR